jgi:hypothetical protein
MGADMSRAILQSTHLASLHNSIRQTKLSAAQLTGDFRGSTANHEIRAATASLSFRTRITLIALVAGFAGTVSRPLPLPSLDQWIEANKGGKHRYAALTRARETHFGRTALLLDCWYQCVQLSRSNAAGLSSTLVSALEALP